MLRIQAIVSAALLFAVGCSAACAGDFLPRAAGGVTVAAAEPSGRSGCPEAGSAAMSESDSISTTRSSAASSSSSSTPVRRAAHVGADEVAADAHSATPSSTGDEDKGSGGAAVAPHKVRSSLRWQSLLPGVMK